MPNIKRINERHLRKNYKDRIFAGIKFRYCCFCNCQLTRKTATLEHVIPLSKGGTWKTTNIKVSCSPCNNERGNKDFDEYMKATEPLRAPYIAENLSNTVEKDPKYIHIPS